MHIIPRMPLMTTVNLIPYSAGAVVAGAPACEAAAVWRGGDVRAQLEPSARARLGHQPLLRRQERHPLMGKSNSREIVLPKE